ncbi:YggS family pyridoxal phosphate-dependent enzyme [Thalassotalea sp. PLHSN55]|uniref:YggS family pyridoxal phosphate-dependent enzyme n=1 Tax=Thalassotalea sp. PLHSN55 TaxID=3435888 RepID=UPI003F858D76
MTTIKNNLCQIKQQINDYCQQSSHNNNVTLLAVSKTKPIQAIEQAYQAGQKAFGENYVQESVEKIAQLSHLSDISWHFIGPIQSNKTKLIAQNFSWVHSVDREKVATRLNEHRSGQDTPLNVCLQVNISEESTKSGIDKNAINDLADFVNSCEHLTLRGIMAIPEKNAPLSTYHTMHELFLSLKAKYSCVDTLSMGMSGDMQNAILSGSTMVRVGSAIFGARN